MRTIRFLFCFSLLCYLGFGLTAQAQTVLVEDFRVTNNGADILLEWDMVSLAGVTEFQVFRSINSEPTKSHVVTLPANGQMKYSYLDDDIFKTEGRVVHYELHIKVNNEVEIITRSLSHNPTSIQRTWGSIKSMFRY